MNKSQLSPLDVPALLKRYHLRPRKGLGQNFLWDDNILKKITGAADVELDDTVLEIGPGLGSLTRHLALASRSVVAVELDEKLIPILEEVLSRFHNIKLIQGDILELDPALLVDGSGYLVVANIPYYITSLVIRHLLESKSAPRRMVLTVQKEVAARICADPGEMSMLSLSVQVYGKPVIVDIIPSSAFFPAPNVDSAIVRIDIFPQPVIHPSRLSTFFHLARAGFNQKRKTLRNSLAPVLDPGISNSILLQAGIDPMRRAETLGLDEWKRLTDIVAGEMK